MRTFRATCRRFIALFQRDQSDIDLAAELESHLQFHIEDNLRAGMSPDEARRQALIKLGGTEQMKEAVRARRTLPWLETTFQDIRFGLRMLRKNPGFTALAVLTLALGIGVNATLFSAYNGVALKPLPVSDPAHVVRFERWFQSGAKSDIQYGFSYLEYVYCRQHSEVFSALVAASWTVPVGGSLPHSVLQQSFVGQLVSANYFTDLGVRPQLGRPFGAGEDQRPGGDPVVVISYPFWQRAFERDPQAIGQTLTLNGVQFTVIGVTPKKFTGTSVQPQVPDFWAPLSMQAQLIPGSDWLNRPDQYHFQIFARLEPSLTRQSAQPQADLLIHQYDATYTANDKTTAVTLQRTTFFPNTDDIRFRALVAAAMLIVGLILFVACVNVGNMLLARGAARQREIGTRRALGASRPRIIRQLLAESILLAGAGGVAGLIVSLWASDLLRIFLQRNTALLGGDFSAVNLAPDVRVMSYTLALAICAGTLLGLSPALQLTRQDLASALKNESPSMGNLRGSRLSSALIAAQVAASIFLLATAGLLTRGLIRSRAAEPGFNTRNNFLLVGGLPGLAARKHLVQSMQGRREFAGAAIGTIPLVATWSLPMTSGKTQAWTLASYASDTYLNLLGVPLLRGRNFTPEESNQGADLAIISESTARLFWPNEDPLGKSFALDMNYQGKLHSFQVIGIAKDARFANLTRIDPAHVYVPIGPSGGPSVGMIVRIYGNPRSALTVAQTLAAPFDKNSFSDMQLINIESGVVAAMRTLTQTLTTFAATLAGLALTLAGVGIYGVLSYLVSQRKKEIGIRIALGASPAALLRSTVLKGLRPVLNGMFLGFTAAAAFSFLLHRTLVFPGSMDFLYGVPFYDPVTFVALFCFALLVATIASAVPARRAMQIDPVAAMRCE